MELLEKAFSCEGPPSPAIFPSPLRKPHPDRQNSGSGHSGNSGFGQTICYDSAVSTEQAAVSDEAPSEHEDGDAVDFLCALADQPDAVLPRSRGKVRPGFLVVDKSAPSQVSTAGCSERTHSPQAAVADAALIRSCQHMPLRLAAKQCGLGTTQARIASFCKFSSQVL